MNGKTVARIIALISFVSVVVYPWLVVFSVVEPSALPVATWAVLGTLAVFANNVPDKGR